MVAEETASGSLAPQELMLVEAWEADRKRLVTLDEIQEALGRDATRGRARMVSLRLRRKGFLSPLGRGVYAVIPVSALGVEAPDVAVSLNVLKVRGFDFYLGFDTAAGHYGWYPEAYGRITIGLRNDVRGSLPSLAGTYIRAIKSDSRAFAEGVIEETWRGVRLPISTREQTILDVVRKVDLVDGFSGCLGVLRAAANDRQLSHTRLAESAASRTSVRQRKRLGWLCEQAGWSWSERELDLLRRGWPSSHRATLGETHGGPAGIWDNRWGLLINISERELRPAVGVR